MLERFSSKGKKLLSELNKIPECDAQIVKTEIDATVDQWLDVSLSNGQLLNLLKKSHITESKSHYSSHQHTGFRENRGQSRKSQEELCFVGGNLRYQWRN